MIDAMQQRIDAELQNRHMQGTTTGPVDPTGEQSRQVLGWVIDALQFVATMDNDDLLGQLSVDIPISNDVRVTDNGYTWNFFGDGSSYSLIYQVSTLADGVPMQELYDLRERRAAMRRRGF